MAAARPDILLVVNADDFGLSPEISRGVLTAHRDGIVTSTSILGNCVDLPAVTALLADAPELGVGAQLTLIGGAPVLPADRVPSLVGADGRFPARAREFYVAWARGHLRPDDIERELEAQVVRLREAGLKLDHINTHQHVGFVPPVGLAVENIARKHGILGVRTAVERPTLSWVTEPPRGAVAAALGGLSWLTRRKMGALRHGPQTWGYVESGQLDEIRILEILGRMGPGSHELICHPGLEDDPPLGVARLGAIQYRRARELAALTSPLVRDAMNTRGARLCRWADLF